MQGIESAEDRWNALLRVSRSWRLEWNVNHLLSRVTKEAVELLGLARGAVYLLERSGLSQRALWPASDTAGAARLEASSRPIAEQVAQSGRPVFAHGFGGQSTESSDAPVRVVFCVPLTASRGILGALYVDSHESQDGLTPKDQEFLEMLGLQAAVALEHAILYQSAITDPLTGLFSHIHFQQEVEQAVRRAARSEQPVSLILIDLDHFKELNDACGHQAGNDCLVQVAAALRGMLRTTDVPARFGGDEFEILLPDTHSTAARDVAEKIRQNIAAIALAQARSVTATVGIAAYPENAGDGQTLFLRADDALYQAKAAGRNQIMRSPHKEARPASPNLLRGRRGTLPAFTSPQIVSPVLARSSAGESSAYLSQDFIEQIDGHPVVRRLGAGSAGEVLLVRQPDLDREVALKRPLTPHLTGEQMQAFEKEAKLTASLNHPGVITVLSMGRDHDSRRYYTMKPLSGSSLAQILEGRRQGELGLLRSFTLNRMLEVLQRVSETIAYAHQRNAVHLDLTPANIIVGDYGEVTVIDWGSGASLGTQPPADARISPLTKGGSRGVLPECSPPTGAPPLTPPCEGGGPASAGLSPAAGASGTPARRGASPNLNYVVGIPYYMSPEQASGSGVRPGPASDVHALGAILYEILTGQPPYKKENTRASLDALLQGHVTPPESVAPEAGIDPVLSELCMKALRPAAEQRPSAQEFSERLGRYVRREMEWIVTHFGSGGHPLHADEWRTYDGKWELADGEWISRGTAENILVWKVPVPGAFRFICEGWIEEAGELSLIGHQPSSDARKFNSHHGYCFEFGAEFNTCTKLARNDHDVMAVLGMRLQPRRKYRIEIEYQEEWVYCYIDGKRVMSYRELFPFSGSHVGFYAWSAGAHLRPLEIQRQSWGLQIPAMRVADSLHEHGSFDAAQQRYQEIAERIPNRIEGLEARLKMGICAASLERPAEALAIFRTLAGSALEPFALAEEALLEVKRKAYRRGLEVFQQLFKRFPDSQAKARVLETVAPLPRPDESIPQEEDLEVHSELLRLGRGTNPAPVQSQIVCHNHLLLCLLRRGLWSEALREAIAFREKILPDQFSVRKCDMHFYAAALANGREELLGPSSPGELADLFWATTPQVHCAVRQGEVERMLANAPAPSKIRECISLAQLHLAARHKREAMQLFEETARRIPGQESPLEYAWLAQGAAETQDEALYHLLVSGVSIWTRSSGPFALAALKARFAVQACDFEGAARILRECPRPRVRYGLGEIEVLEALLVSLGFLKEHKTAVQVYCLHDLAGTELDLARMFLGLREPRPGALWPHPLWRPELRLWLALWLEARGEIKAAREIALPAVDARYGLMHSQTPLAALLERTSNGPR